MANQSVIVAAGYQPGTQLRASYDPATEDWTFAQTTEPTAF